MVSCRLGSVGQDTQLCLWDITDDVLRQPILCSAVTIKSKDCNNGEACNMTTSNHINSNNCIAVTTHANYTNHNNNNKDNQTDGSSTSKHSPATLTQRLVLLSFGERRDSGGSSSKKYSSRSNSSGSDKYSNCVRYSELEDPMKLIGTAACPRFDQCPLLEPLICKKISNERLSALIFKEDCILTSCYDGSVYTWARPGKVVSNSVNPFPD